jgi:hypothetical protein
LKQKAKAALTEDEFSRQEKSLAEKLAQQIADLEDILIAPTSASDIDEEYKKESLLAKEAALKIARVARPILASRAMDVI